MFHDVHHFVTFMHLVSACGKYEKIAGGGTGYIASPTNYGAYAYCMWWLETDMGYQLSINVTYVGDTNDGRCGDYVIVSMTLCLHA